MEITFLTPQAGAFAALVLAPLLVFLGRERRAHQIRDALVLAGPSLLARTPVALSLVLVPGLLGLAATQPVLESTRTRSERTDAEAFFVIDASRSMLASSRSGAPTRFERARDLAFALQQSVPEVPAGLASLTDRVLPHLFPTTDARVFSTTLRDSMEVEQPPASRYSQLATALGALAAVPRTNYFRLSAEKRLLVVLTDGETLDVEPDLARAFQRRPRTEVVLVQVGNSKERIYETGAAESGYQPDPAARAKLAHAASFVRGRVFSEDELVEVGDAARRIFGSGPTRPRAIEGQRVALMPFVTLAAFIPLLFLLWRRNV